ncbi:DUF4269 domain-containing protein [Leptospira sp. 201903070]|uniref:DUF4269 domain-containing protein n=1 Tax=Leptospira ainlahdjerensis TaxID=2810033 RepID=A0ABS2U897_9LEPT|nr:DUF4269 domain-containing protein [Leptospira ainlahdjerensis]MBM9576588.1 DUF4269 domain-containing protein [Leptospira ainlahdjerensis]
MNFRNARFLVDSLKIGNQKQKLLWEDLEEYSILKTLLKYDPYLAGTIPLGIDHDQSDVDILCEFSNEEEFYSFGEFTFKNFKGFQILRKIFQDLPAILIRFQTEKFKYEIFAQRLPVLQQMGYVHFMIESEILFLGGPRFKEGIQTLKKEGWKTEEAFCKLLGIREDPYRFLFGLIFFPPEELRKFVLESEFFLKKDI